MVTYYAYCKSHHWRGANQPTRDQAAKELKDHILGSQPPHEVNIYQMYEVNVHGQILYRVRKIE